VALHAMTVAPGAGGAEAWFVMAGREPARCRLGRGQERPGEGCVELGVSGATVRLRGVEEVGRGAFQLTTCEPRPERTPAAVETNVTEVKISPAWHQTSFCLPCVLCRDPSGFSLTQCVGLSRSWRAHASVRGARLACGTENPAHGYALMKAYRERSGCPVSIGNVYRELSRLEGEGLMQLRRTLGSRSQASAVSQSPTRPRGTREVAGGPGPHVDVHYGRSAIARLAILGDLDAVRAGEFLNELHTELWNRARRWSESGRSRASGRSMGTALPTRCVLLCRRAKAPGDGHRDGG